MDDSCRIMIVDDEFIMRQGIKFMMKWENGGYEIVGEASNGRDALEKLAELSPHIVLCDIAMPVMDGLDFIKVAHKEYPDIKIIVLSGYDNFEYVREALLNGASDYVLKPTLNPETLTALLNKIAADIPGLQLKKRQGSDLDGLFEKFMTGSDACADGRLTFAMPGSCFRFFVMQLKCRDKKGADLSGVLFDKVEEFFKNAGNMKYFRFLYSHKEVLCAVINYDMRDEVRVQNSVRALASSLGMISDRALVVLGTCQKNLEGIRDEFISGGLLEKESFYYKGEHLLFTDGSDTGRTLKRFDFRSFSSIVSDRKYGEAICMLRDYIYEAAACQMLEFKLKNQMKNLVYNLIGSNEENAVRLEAICREAFEAAEQSLWSEDFLCIVDDMLKKISDMLPKDTSDTSAHLGEIFEYIREHYVEDLTLQSVADTFNFSYSYLSAYFNQYAHEGFSEYLNKIRIRKACEYLEHSDRTIAEVSSAVGYADHSYFCRVFKKVTGETPSGYRRERQRR